MALLARKLVKKICEIQAHTGNTTCLDLGESGRVLVTGGQDKVVNLWAFGSDKCFLSLQGHNGSIMCAKFASNDNIVYSADENGVIKRWILEQEDEHSTFYGHLKSVKSIDCHPFGVRVVLYLFLLRIKIPLKSINYVQLLIYCRIILFLAVMTHQYDYGIFVVIYA